MTPSPDDPITLATTPMTITIQQACALSGLGRSTIWEMVSNGQLRSVKIAGRRLIGYSSLRALLEGAL
jgi:excisionase family DNA binding protein